MALSHITAIAEQGQIVTVRQRRYVVAEVVPSALPADVLHNTSPEPQHLITLNSIEDDARINERAGLPEPTGFDQPERFDAFLNAIRWGAISSADTHFTNQQFYSLNNQKSDNIW